MFKWFKTFLKKNKLFNQYIENPYSATTKDNEFFYIYQLVP